MMRRQNLAVAIDHVERQWGERMRVARRRRPSRAKQRGVTDLDVAEALHCALDSKIDHEH
jgi:hypothetical protein